MSGAPAAGGPGGVEPELARLSREVKLHLAGFVCWYAWADRTIQAAERRVVKQLITQLALTGSDAVKVESWLVTPPPLEMSNLERIPADLRHRYVEVAEKVLFADGRIDIAERNALEKMKKVLLGIEPPPQRR